MKRHSLVQFDLNQPVFQEIEICNYKIHLLSFLNTRQTNHGIFLSKAGENFNLAKMFWKVKVRV